MKLPRLAIILALCALPAVHAQAQYNPALAGFLSRILGPRGASFSLARSTPAGDVAIEASFSPAGATYSASVTTPSGATMGVSGTATNLSPAGASFSGTITSPQGPNANYSGSVAFSPNSMAVDASVTREGDDADSPPAAPAEISVRVSAPAGPAAPSASFSGSVSGPQGASANFDGSISAGPGSVEVSTSFTPAGGPTTTRTVAFTPPGAPEENEESPLQKILKRLGVIRPNG